MSARIEAQAPSSMRPWAMPWIAALLVLLLAVGTLVWALNRNSGQTATTHHQPAVSTATHQDARGPGLVETGGVTRPIAGQPVAPAVDPGAGRAPSAPAAGQTASRAGGWFFHMISTGGETHPAPSS